MQIKKSTEVDVQKAIDFGQEVALGERFQFGKNWQSFLSVLDEQRIAEAEQSLQRILRINDLKGKSFLDIGSGSGIFSVAAMRLGADRVHSFDYDPQSAECTRELKRRCYPDAKNWTIDRGSALDVSYLNSLGQWDLVYSWGVLHHTGAMWDALGNAAGLVKKGGRLFISIYNDQGHISNGWRVVKRLYNRGPLGRCLIWAIFLPYFVSRRFAADVILLKNPVKSYTEYRKRRGMSRVHDWFDWFGGYPFEVAKPEEIFDFYRERGFVLDRLKTVAGSLGCNEFVFVKK